MKISDTYDSDKLVAYLPHDNTESSREILDINRVNIALFHQGKSGFCFNSRNNPAGIVVITQPDDAMQPRIFAGDTIVIDTGRTDTFSADGIFAVSIDGAAPTTRDLRRTAEGRILACTGDLLSCIDMHDMNIKIIGKVAGFFSSKGFD